MTKVFALLLSLFLATPALAWWTPPPVDPYQDTPDHYQANATMPVQDRLEDCWLFTIQTWQRPQDHWTHQAAWQCTQIANQHSRGLMLSDSQIALETLLLDYESQARAWSIKAIKASHIERPINDDHTVPKALALRSGWYDLERLQISTATDIGLIDILSHLP